MPWAYDSTSQQYVLHSVCHVSTCITNWCSFSTLIWLFLLILPIFRFSTPLELHFGALIDIFVVFKPISHFKILSIRFLVSSPKLYYILERFWLSTLRTFINIQCYVFLLVLAPIGPGLYGLQYFSIFLNTRRIGCCNTCLIS